MTVICWIMIFRLSVSEYLSQLGPAMLDGEKIKMRFRWKIQMPSSPSFWALATLDAFLLLDSKGRLLPGLSY